jgi:hypothetical protein
MTDARPRYREIFIVEAADRAARSLGRQYGVRGSRARARASSAGQAALARRPTDIPKPLRDSS